MRLWLLRVKYRRPAAIENQNRPHQRGNSCENDAAMREDPIVLDVRRTREELSSRFNFDVKAIFADMRTRQAALGARLVSRNKRVQPANGIDGAKNSPSGISKAANAVNPHE
jgi:hypothetical protein